MKQEQKYFFISLCSKLEIKESKFENSNFRKNRQRFGNYFLSYEEGEKVYIKIKGILNKYSCKERMLKKNYSYLNIYETVPFALLGKDRNALTDKKRFEGKNYFALEDTKLVLREIYNIFNKKDKINI